MRRRGEAASVENLKTLCAFSAYALGSIAIGLIAVALGYLIAKQ